MGQVGRGSWYFFSAPSPRPERRARASKASKVPGGEKHSPRLELAVAALMALMRRWPCFSAPLESPQTGPSMMAVFQRTPGIPANRAVDDGPASAHAWNPIKQGR